MKGDYFMKRMVDNKKLSEIEASGGTQWYQHVIRLTNDTILTLITLRQDALKDGGWPIGNHLVFLVDASGRSTPKTDTSFHVLSKRASTAIFVKYINDSNQVASYNLSESDIASEEVTPL